MTEPRGLETEAALEVKPEVIQDLDVTGDDADVIAGGNRIDPCAGSKMGE